MSILSNAEYNNLKLYDPINDIKIRTSFHEAGHALLIIMVNETFTKVVVTQHNGGPGVSGGGYVDGYAVIFDSEKKLHNDIMITLAGWAADEIFNRQHIEFKAGNLHGYDADLKHINDSPLKMFSMSEDDKKAYIKIMQNRTKIMLAGKIKELKAIAFALFEKGELSYEEVKDICK